MHLVMCISTSVSLLPIRYIFCLSTFILFCFSGVAFLYISLIYLQSQSFALPFEKGGEMYTYKKHESQG